MEVIVLIVALCCYLALSCLWGSLADRKSKFAEPVFWLAVVCMLIVIAMGAYSLYVTWR